MVNPQKHANKLNAEDIKNIYKKLTQQYRRTRDLNNRKEINQQILIMILLCRKFPANDIIRVSYEFFEPENSKTLLYKHLQEHLLNNFCQMDGPLLSNRQNRPLNMEDVEKLLEKVDTGTDKKLSVKELNVINIELDDFGKTFNKKKVKKYLDLKNKVNTFEEMIKKNDMDDEKTGKKQSIETDILQNLEKKTSENLLKTEGYLEEVMEKQDILEDNLNNKYNKITNTLNKVHQNIKSQNSKYNTLVENFKQLPLIKDEITTNIERQNEKIEELNTEIRNINNIIKKMGDSTMSITADSLTNNQQQLLIEHNDNNRYFQSLTFNDYKQFMINWFSKNMKVTRNSKDAVDMDQIKEKLEKYIEAQSVRIDRQSLYSRLESYLSAWYNKQNTKLGFSDIKTDTINGRVIFTNIKFIDFREERDNRIKNSIMVWLKEHTCEMENSRTYTEDILNSIKPLFEENGWIITSQEEWEKLHEAGFTKICPKRTFSQIIGKAVQELYPFISKDTIKRDTPTPGGKVTWYPNIHILDIKTSADTRNTIQNELTADLEETNNIVYEYLKENLVFTGADDEKTYKQTVFDKITQYLDENDVEIAQEELYIIFESMIESISHEQGIKQNKKSEYINQFILEEEYVLTVDDIVEDWMDNHVMDEGNADDKAYLDEIYEKLLTHIHNEDINVVNEDVYEKIPYTLRKTFITKTAFSQTIDKTIKQIGKQIQTDPTNREYIPGMKIVRYNTLKAEDITGWVQQHIEEHLRNNVAYKEKILQEFEEYLSENNIKNKTKHTLGELLDTATTEYYKVKENVNLKITKDQNDEFYVLV